MFPRWRLCCVLSPSSASLNAVYPARHECSVHPLFWWPFSIRWHSCLPPSNFLPLSVPARRIVGFPTFCDLYIPSVSVFRSHVASYYWPVERTRSASFLEASVSFVRGLIGSLPIILPLCSAASCLSASTRAHSTPHRTALGDIIKIEYLQR